MKGQEFSKTHANADIKILQYIHFQIKNADLTL